MHRIEALIRKKFINWDKVLLILACTYFLLRLCYFAFSITPLIPPDEKYHIDLSLLYSQYHGLILPDSEVTYHLGLVSTIPFFYHFLMGRLLHLNIFNITPILFLRLMNIALSLGSIFFFYKLLKLLTDNKWIHVLGIIGLTNIPMYSFLSAFVNYDNLVNFLSVVSFYYLFCYVKFHDKKYLLIAAIAMLLGTLSKISFVPLLFIFLCLYLYHEFKERKEFVFCNIFPQKINFLHLLGILTIAWLIFLNYRIYMVNIIKYSTPVPYCTKILKYEQCAKGKGFRIDEELKGQEKKVDQTRLIGLHDYFFYWKMSMVTGVFGIFGHQFMIRNSLEVLPYNLLIVLFVIFFIRYFKTSDNILINYCVFSVLVYLGLLFYKVNYGIYRHYGNVVVTLQGRYAFPVIYPIVFLFVYFLLNFPNKIAKILFGLLIVIIFIGGDFPYFFRHVPESWYINTEISRIWHPQ